MRFFSVRFRCVLYGFVFSLSVPVFGDSPMEQNQFQEPADEKRIKGIPLPPAESGRELYEQKRYEEALAKFEEILTHDMNDEEALRLRDLCKNLIAKDAYKLALRKARDGDTKTAVAYVQKALKHRPNYPEAEELLKNLRINYRGENIEKSKELYTQSLKAYLAGDHEKALELAKQAQELWPYNVGYDHKVERLSQLGAGTPK